MIKKLLADKNNLFWFFSLLAIFTFLVEAIVLIFYRETWFDELNYLWKSYLILKGSLIPFQDIILEYPPLFVPIYGLGQILFGPSFYIGRLTSAVLSVFLLILVFLVAKKMSSRWWGLAAVFAVLSNLLLMGNYISATLYSLAAVLVMAVFWIETSDINRKKKIYFSAILLGLMMLTRINLLPVVFIFLAYFIFLKIKWVEIALFCGLILAVISLGYLPVVWANPDLALSNILQPFYSFGPMKELSSGIVGGQSFLNFFSTLVGFLKEFYSFLLLFSAVIFYALFENRKNIGNFLKQESVFFLISLTALVLLATHFFYWRLEGKIYYANYFMPLIIISIVVGIARFLPKNKAIITVFIFSLLLNFSINLYRTDVLSSPREESDLARVAKGSEFLAENTKTGDKILAFDNSIFHVFAADRTIFPPLINRDFLYAPGLSMEKAKELKFYNFEMFKDWLLKEADYVVINKEQWSLSFLKSDYWGFQKREGNKEVEEIKNILSQNYKIVGAAENVYPRKYTEGNDEGTLELYKRK